MKKIVCLLLAFALLFTLAACGKQGGDNQDVQSSVEDTKNFATDTESVEYDFGEPKVGDYITFGSYEQDNNTYNGKEPIEWLVLDVVDGQILVISKFALDAMAFDSESDCSATTWEICTLRKWLNDDFINESFSIVEQGMIPTVTVPGDDNLMYNVDAGNDTQDKIFVLSYSEVEKYFDSDNARCCKPTDYAISQGSNVSPEYFQGNCWWWLRTPGDVQEKASRVNWDGFISNGDLAMRDSGAIRPAMWITVK